jgi:hypothetical protein
MRAIAADKILQPAVSEAGVESVPVHFIAGALNIPIVMPDSVDSGHHSGSVMTSMAMHKDRLIGWIVDDLEELFHLPDCRPGFVTHSHPVVSHARGPDFVRLTVLPFGLQVEHRLYPKRR